MPMVIGGKLGLESSDRPERQGDGEMVIYVIGARKSFRCASTTGRTFLLRHSNVILQDISTGQITIIYQSDEAFTQHFHADDIVG